MHVDVPLCDQVFGLILVAVDEICQMVNRGEPSTEPNGLSRQGRSI